VDQLVRGRFRFANRGFRGFAIRARKRSPPFGFDPLADLARTPVLCYAVPCLRTGNTLDSRDGVGARRASARRADETSKSAPFPLT
jgi:hypothetical protein